MDSIQHLVQHNPQYYELLSYFQIKEGDYSGAENSIRRLLVSDVYNHTFQRLGNALYGQQKNAQAEEAYILSVNMVPNRFTTRHSLFRFYKETGQREKALRCANEILALPIKIPSIEVERIRAIVKGESDGIRYGK